MKLEQVEIARLKREVAKLKGERDVLKAESWRDVIAVHKRIMALAIVVQKFAYTESGNFNTLLCHTAG